MPVKKYLADVSFLYPADPDPDRLVRGKAEEPFSADAINWLHALSQVLKRDPETRRHPDVATFAFFCRKANLMQLKKQYHPVNRLRLGRGLVFHITPQNVPTTFAWSLASGILSGNANIVKVPSVESEQSAIICRAICTLGHEKEHQPVSSRQVVVQYDRKSLATAYFSSICNVRIIWGSDATIEAVRKNRLAPRAFDVTFASRDSLCVINADRYLQNNMPESVAAGFYNDTYLFGQEACTAPHLIVWLGRDENIEAAKNTFWAHLYHRVQSAYRLQPHAAVDKLATFYHQAVHGVGIKKTAMPDNLVWRTELKELPGELSPYRCGGGYFSECSISSLSGLAAILTGQYQTLSCYGFEKEELVDFVIREKPNGIDRMVPIGRTTDFSLTHDGTNLIETLTREITVT